MNAHPDRVLPVLLLTLIISAPAIAAAPVLPKEGACPTGYHTEGRYCVGNRADPPTAVSKEGPCPTGYHTEGRYCIGNRP
ncbi:MAG: hypothetical protein IPL99_17935 [Candidatus Competibacteraceae bacterium]|nr:hypothetical protein [Candidatus Competibacteraceae bacterium]